MPHPVPGPRRPTSLTDQDSVSRRDLPAGGHQEAVMAITKGKRLPSALPGPGRRSGPEAVARRGVDVPLSR